MTTPPTDVPVLASQDDGVELPVTAEGRGPDVGPGAGLLAALGAVALVVAADGLRWWAGPLAGAAAHGIVAIVLANLFVFGPGNRRPLLLGLATVSATRVVLLALPFVHVPPGWRLLAVAAATGAGAVLAALHLHPRRRLLGWFEPVGWSAALVAAAGVPVGLLAGPLLRPEPVASAALATGLALVLVAAADGLLWFGVVRTGAVEALGRRTGPVAVGLVAASGFLGTGPVPLLALVGATAVGLSWWCDHRRSIAGAVAALAVAGLVAHLVASGGQ